MKYLSNVATLEYFQDKCTGCKRCVEVCPHAVFEIFEKKARITDLDRCMECGACMQNCDSDAIKVQSGVGCSAAIIYSILTGNEPSCGCDDSGAASCC